MSPLTESILLIAAGSVLAKNIFIPLFEMWADRRRGEP